MTGSDEDLQVFADRFNAAIDKAGISRKELARRVRMNPSTLDAWANAKAWPSIKYMPRIADALDVSLYWLLGIEK